VVAYHLSLRAQVAELVFVISTVATLLATDPRKNCHPQTQPVLVNPRPQTKYHPGTLVPQDPWILSRQGAFGHIQVGATKTGAHDPDKHLPRARFWDRALAQAKVALALN